jgi:protoporphyrinogen oxidase
LEGLLDAQRQSALSKQTPPPATFADWIVGSFGAGLARVFLTPYNFKVWATEPARMSSSWVGERVATVDLKRILRNIIEGRDDRGWGANATFRFPLHGGTGRIWQAIAERLPADRLHLGAEAVAIDTDTKAVRLSDGRVVPYDWLITTAPLDCLMTRISGQALKANPQAAAQRLCYSGTHVIGVGLAGPVPERLATKCWMYFPEPELPFYRVTVLSNYSPHNVSHPGRQWSLMAEVSESACKPVDAACVVEQTIAGLRAAQLIGPQAAIESVWHRRLEHGYPTPSLDRDTWLGQIEPELYARNILSRGRFGAWKYEVGNMDHSFMQGVEAADHILRGTSETTRHQPAVVNASKLSGR